MASQSVTAAHAQSVLPQTWLSNLAGWQDALPLRNATADWSTWQYVVTLILGLVVYDQGKGNPRTAVLELRFLVLLLRS